MLTWPNTGYLLQTRRLDHRFGRISFGTGAFSHSRAMGTNYRARQA